METLKWMYIVIGALFAVLGIPLLQRRIKPNWWYGFRTPQTLNNPTVWYETNAYFARWMIGIGVVTIIAALVVPGTDVDTYAIIVSGVVVVGLIIGIALSWRRMQAAAR